MLVKRCSGGRGGWSPSAGGPGLQPGGPRSRYYDASDPWGREAATGRVYLRAPQPRDTHTKDPGWFLNTFHEKRRRGITAQLPTGTLALRSGSAQTPEELASLRGKRLLPNGRKRPIIREFQPQIQQDTTQQRNQPPFTDPPLTTDGRREKSHGRNVRAGSREPLLLWSFLFK